MTIQAQDNKVSVDETSLTTVARTLIDLHFLVGNIVSPTDSAFIGQLDLNGLRYDPRFADGFLIGLILTFDVDTATVDLQGQSQVITATDYDTNQQTLFSFGGSFPAAPSPDDKFTVFGISAQKFPLATMDGSLVYKLNTIKDVTDNLPNNGELTNITDQLTSIKSDTSNTDAIVDHLPDDGYLTSLAQEATLGTPETGTISGDIASVQTTVNSIDSRTVDIKATVDSNSTTIDAIFARVEPDIGDNLGQDHSQIRTDIAAVKTVVDTISTVQGVTASDESESTYSYTSGTSEQTLVEITTATRKTLNGVWLDMSNITTTGVIRLYYKINGSDYREFVSYPYDASIDNDGFFANLNMGIDHDFKVTYQADSSEGADRDISYAIIFDIRE
jgi:hypothetical protein